MIRLLFLSLCILFCSVQADAQYNWVNSMVSISSTVNRDLGDVLRTKKLVDDVDALKNRQKGAPTSPALSAPAKVNYAATDFRPTGSRLMLEQFAAVAAEAERPRLRQALRDVLVSYEKEVRKNNLAYALAFFIGGNLQIIGETEIPDDASEALAADCHNALLEMDALKTMSAKDKQQLYETLILTTGMAAALYYQAVESHDDALKKQAQAMARESLEQFGFKFN